MNIILRWANNTIELEPKADIVAAQFIAACILLMALVWEAFIRKSTTK